MSYGYIRVSRDKQRLENQGFEINKFAQANDLSMERFRNEIVQTFWRLRQQTPVPK